jgi:hypothetical protein
MLGRSRGRINTRQTGLLVALLSIAAARAQISSTPRNRLVYALLADNRLMAVKLNSGEIVAEQTLGSAAPTPGAAGQLMGLSADHTSLLVLVRGSPDQVVVVNTATAHVRASYLAGENDASFSSLAVGPQSGRIFLFGNRRNSSGGIGDVEVVALDPRTGQQLAHLPASEAFPKDYDWRVYQGAVAPDEKRVFVSYHGVWTTGVDWFDIRGRDLVRCPNHWRPDCGCIGGHGEFVLYKNKVLAATGSRLLLSDQDGTLREGFDTDLQQTHLMEFALDERAGMVYAISPCGYAPGLSAVDVRSAGVPLTMTDYETGKLSLSSFPKPLMRTESACGARIAIADGIAVIGKTAIPVPSADKPGSLVFVNAKDGRVLRQIVTPSEPADLLVAE